jgi:uncharacterized integral membrane protein
MTDSRTDSGRSRTPALPATSNASGPPLNPDANHHPRRRPTRISSLHVGLVTAAVLLVLLVVFLVQNARTVEISFLGAHLRVSLAVAMLAAAVAGALITGAAGTARIAQLRRSRRTSDAAAGRHSETPQRT